VVDNSNVLMLLHEESDLDCLYPNISLALFSIYSHLIPTPEAAVATVTLKPGFDRW